MAKTLKDGKLLVIDSIVAQSTSLKRRRERPLKATRALRLRWKIVPKTPLFNFIVTDSHSSAVLGVCSFLYSQRAVVKSLWYSLTPVFSERGAKMAYTTEIEILASRVYIEILKTVIEEFEWILQLIYPHRW